MWKKLMLSPFDYSYDAINHPLTRKLMSKIQFEHGGKEYDDLYPEGIPTSIQIKTKGSDSALDSGLILFPHGHARNESEWLGDILQHKFILLGKIGLKKSDLIRLKVNLENIDKMSNEELQEIYDCNLLFSQVSIDSDEGLSLETRSQADEYE